MADQTKIEWTDATWNPVTGCDEVSPGCDHCYAKTLAERFRGTEGHYFEHGFDVVLRPDKLDQPLRWKRPRRVFVNSMSDLFHKDIPDEYIAKVFAVMSLAPQHTFQVLTKRHGRMRSLLFSGAFKVAIFDAAWDLRPEPFTTTWPLPNVWLGVSVEDQKRADLRIPALLTTPAAVRFLSCEPLLGPIDIGAVEIPLAAYHLQPSGIDWVIVGGESGRGARPMHPDWARSLRDQCADAGVAFHFKQWGEHVASHRESDPWAWTDPTCWVEDAAMADPQGHYTAMWRVGKKAAGRELDGRTHDAFPEVVAP
jgi:protein gp37